jgi:hypothetical protein
VTRCCCRHVDTLLGEPRQTDAALDLMIEKIGAPAADLLEKVANDGNDLERRQRAAAALDDIGEGKRVDQVSLSLLELRKAASCEEKKVVVVKLKGLGDVKALPALRALGGRRLGPLRFGGADTRCMKQELTETIAALEEKDGSAAPVRKTRRGRADEGDALRPEEPAHQPGPGVPAVSHLPGRRLFTLPVLNGADFLTVFLFRNLGLSARAYIAYTIAVAILFAVAVAVLRRKQRFDPKLILPVLVESAIYALTMGSLIVFVMTRCCTCRRGWRAA